MTSSSGDVETVERIVRAPASAIFELLADPSRHREFDGSGMVGEAPSGSQRLGLGSTFAIRMRFGYPYTMVNTVVEYEPDRRIAWQPRPKGRLMGRFIGGRVWRYELEPVESGTLVRESWDIRQERIRAAVRPMRRKMVKAMEATLSRLDERLSSPA